MNVADLSSIEAGTQEQTLIACTIGYIQNDFLGEKILYIINVVLVIFAKDCINAEWNSFIL